MKAILLKDFGDADQLYPGECPAPQPGEDELLVRVRATALNRADVLQRKGQYPPPPGASEILGLECAGEVETTGAAVQRWRPGDRVCALLPGGGYAEFAVVPERMAMPIPEGFTFEQAAAIPEAFLTAYQALHWLGKVRANECVLIHAGASGVGTAAIQLAHHAGAIVAVTAGSKEKLQACRDLGAEYTINYKEEDFAPEIHEMTGGKGVDLIIDFIGAAYFQKNLSALATDGRLVNLAMMGGRMVKNADISPILRKRLTVTGSTLRNRSLAYKIELTEAFAAHAMPLFEQKKLAPIIARVFPWMAVAEAHRYMEANLNIGKIVLRFADS